MKASSLGSASSAAKEVKGVLIFDIKMGRLHKKIRFLIVPSLATNVILDTAFISKCVEKISPKANFNTSINSIPVAIVSAPRLYHFSRNKNHESYGQPKFLRKKSVCVTFQAITLPAMTETDVKVQITAGRI